MRQSYRDIANQLLRVESCGDIYIVHINQIPWLILSINAYTSYYLASTDQKCV